MFILSELDEPISFEADVWECIFSVFCMVECWRTFKNVPKKHEETVDLKRQVYDCIFIGRTREITFGDLFSRSTGMYKTL